MFTYDQLMLVLIIYASGMPVWAFYLALRGYTFDNDSIISAILWPLTFANLLGVICRHFIKKIF